MNCKQVRAMLSEYVDGEVDKSMLVEVRSHIESCPECRQELHDLEQTIALMTGIGEVQVPADLVARVHEKIASAGGTSAHSGLWMFFAGPQFRIVAAACLILGVCTYGLLHEGGTRSETGVEKPVFAKQIVRGVEKVPARSDLPASKGTDAAKDASIDRRLVPAPANEVSSEGGARAALESADKLSVARLSAKAASPQSHRRVDVATQLPVDKSARTGLFEGEAYRAASAEGHVSDRETALAPRKKSLERATEVPGPSVRNAPAGPAPQEPSFVGLSTGAEAQEEVDTAVQPTQTSTDKPRHVVLGIKIPPAGKMNDGFVRIRVASSNDAVRAYAAIKRYSTDNTRKRSDSAQDISGTADASSGRAGSQAGLVRIRKADYQHLISDIAEIGVITATPQVSESKSDQTKTEKKLQDAADFLNLTVRVEIDKPSVK